MRLDGLEHSAGFGHDLLADAIGRDEGHLHRLARLLYFHLGGRVEPRGSSGRGDQALTADASKRGVSTTTVHDGDRGELADEVQRFTHLIGRGKSLAIVTIRAERNWREKFWQEIQMKMKRKEKKKKKGNHVGTRRFARLVHNKVIRTEPEGRSKRTLS